MVETEGKRILAKKLAELEKSQTWLAEALGVHQSSISQWVAGNSRPKSEQRELLNVVLGVPVDAWSTLEEQDELKQRAERARELMRINP